MLPNRLLICSLVVDSVDRVEQISKTLKFFRIRKRYRWNTFSENNDNNVFTLYLFSILPPPLSSCFVYIRPDDSKYFSEKFCYSFDIYSVMNQNTQSCLCFNQKWSCKSLDLCCFGAQKTQRKSYLGQKTYWVTHKLPQIYN